MKFSYLLSFLSLFLIVFTGSISATMVGYGGPTVVEGDDINIYQGNLTNLSQMQDTNIPAPNDNDVLTWDSATGKWIADTLAGVSKWIISTTNGFFYTSGDTLYFNDTLLNMTIDTRSLSASDTNETIRFNQLTGNCTAGYVMQGVHEDGTRVCVVDQTGAGGGAIYDQVLNTTSDVTFNNITSTSFFIGDGSFLTNLPAGSESDPYWFSNLTAYNSTWVSTYNATYNSYNSTGLIQDWNSTGLIANWSTASYVESDPFWTENLTAYNSTWVNMTNLSYVPYNGATQNIDIGSNNFTTTGTGYFDYVEVTSNVSITNDIWIGGNTFAHGDAYFFGNIFPTTTLSSDIGSGPNRWATLYIQNISSDYIDNAYDIETSNLNATGNITAAGYFLGNGSQLTDINVVESDPLWTTNYSNFSLIYGYALNGSDLWNGNYSNYTTGWLYATNSTLSWSNAINGTLFSSEDWNTNYSANNDNWNNRTNMTYNAYNSTGLIRDWNATGYIINWSLASAIEQDPFWTENFTLYNTTWSTDTTYIAGDYMILDGNNFSANITALQEYADELYASIDDVFSGSWYDLTDMPIDFFDGFDNDTTYSHLSNFTDDLGNRGYTSNLNFSNDAGYYNSSDFDYNDYYLAANPFNFYNSTTLPLSSETDPHWTSNLTAYNSTWNNRTNTSYYLLTNPFSFYNSTDFTITDYYEKSNPFGFYNSTNPQSETDPYWTSNLTAYNSTWISTYNSTYNAYNSTGLIRDWNSSGYIINWSLASAIESDPFWTSNLTAYNDTWTSVINSSYYLVTNPFSFYNSTDFDYNDYYLASNPFSFYNSTNPQPETDPFWTENLTAYNSTWVSTYNSTYEVGYQYATNGSGSYVPYTGATGAIDIGVNNLTTSGNISARYFYGQPLDGSIGSGVIECDDSDSRANVNLTIDGLDVTYPSLVVRLVDVENNIKYCEIAGDTVSVTDDQHSVYYVDSDCSLKETSLTTYLEIALSPGGQADIFNVMAHSGKIEMYKGVTLLNKVEIKVRKNIFYTTNLDVVSGLLLSKDTFPNITINLGQYVYLRDIVETTSQNITEGAGLEIVSKQGGEWTFDERNYGLNLSYCNDGTNTIACSNPSKYRRYFIFETGFLDGADLTEIHQLLPSNSLIYASLADCLNTQTTPLTYSLPDIYTYTALPIYAYCGRASDTSWTGSFIDLRNVQTGTASGEIDSSIFLTKDGSRPLTSNWNQGAFNLTNTSSWFLGKINASSIQNAPWLTSSSETDPLWTSNFTLYNSTWSSMINSSYYLATNPFGFYNSTTPSPETLWTSNLTAYNSTWSSMVNTSYYLASNPFGFYNSTNPQSISDDWINESGDLMTGRLNISNELSIIGNYPIKWFDNTGTTQYSYVIANSGEFKVSAVDVPMNFYYGNIGSNLGASMDKDNGNWTFTNNVTADYFIGDGSLLTGINSTNNSYYLANNPFSFYNSTDFTITDYYEKSNPFGFYNSTNPQSETDPYWTSNLTAYNSTWSSVINTSYYLANNPFSFYNSTDFTITDYYEKSNPFGFYNSTNPQSETDPYWTSNLTAYNSTWSSVINDSYYLKSNPHSYWNDTYATFNKSYADTLYRSQNWDNITGIPHATPSDGDTTHFSLADEIYDWAVGLFIPKTGGTFTGNINMSNNNITNIECLRFESGGSICDLS